MRIGARYARRWAGLTWAGLAAGSAATLVLRRPWTGWLAGHRYPGQVRSHPLFREALIQYFERNAPDMDILATGDVRVDVDPTGEWTAGEFAVGVLCEHFLQIGTGARIPIEVSIAFTK